MKTRTIKEAEILNDVVKCCPRKCKKSEAIPSPVKNSKVYTRESCGMIVKAYFIDEDKFIPKGEYKETELDREKKQVDILLTSIDGNWYTLCLQKPIEIKEGRGVKRYDDKVISVTESIYKKLQSQYSVKCDF